MYDGIAQRISALEAAYGDFPLISAAWSDIHENSLQDSELTVNLVKHFDFWETFLTTNKIQLLVIDVPSITSTTVAWIVCQKLGVHYTSFVDIAPLGTQLVVTSSWQGHYDQLPSALERAQRTGVDKTSDSYSKAVQYAHRMKTHPTKTAESVNKLQSEQFSHIPFHLIKKIPGFLTRERIRRQYYMRSGGTGWFLQWLKAYKNHWYHKYINVFEDYKANEQSRYFLFPLHERGEWSNYTWMGLKYGDLLAQIREISACLPLGRELFVKEHPLGFKKRPTSFYRTLKSMRAVRLINPHADSFNLIRGAEGVVTLGSTMGWEAWVMGRPTILLGDPWYSYCPNIYRAHNSEDLARLLQTASKLPVATEEDVVMLVTILYDISFKAYEFPHVNTLQPDNILKWAQALNQKISTLES
ncbi:MAG: hypothetical protein WD208_05760 [Dehalococcoidia bacterium]